MRGGPSGRPRGRRARARPPWHRRAREPSARPVRRTDRRRRTCPAGRSRTRGRRRRASAARGARPSRRRPSPDGHPAGTAAPGARRRERPRGSGRPRGRRSVTDPGRVRGVPAYCRSRGRRAARSCASTRRPCPGRCPCASRRCRRGASSTLRRGRQRPRPATLARRPRRPSGSADRRRAHIRRESLAAADVLPLLTPAPRGCGPSG